MKKSKSKQKADKNAEGSKQKEMSATLKTELENFLQYPNITRLNRNIRKTLLLYLTYENTLPLDFDDFMLDLYFLYEFLDAVEDEKNVSKS
jgi:hypothetical protein